MTMSGTSFPFSKKDRFNVSSAPGAEELRTKSRGEYWIIIIIMKLDDDNYKSECNDQCWCSTALCGERRKSCETRGRDGQTDSGLVWRNKPTYRRFFFFFLSLWRLIALLSVIRGHYGTRDIVGPSEPSVFLSCSLWRNRRSTDRELTPTDRV